LHIVLHCKISPVLLCNVQFLLLCHLISVCKDNLGTYVCIYKLYWVLHPDVKNP
jgi:hypothetical protein